MFKLPLQLQHVLHTLEWKHEDIALHWWIVVYTHWNGNMRTLHCIDVLSRTHIGMQTWGHCIALMDCHVHTLECKHEDIALHWWIVAYTHWNANMRTLHCIDGLSRTHIGMQTWGHCIALMDCRVHTHWNADMRTLHCIDGLSRTHIGMQTWGHCIALMDCHVHTLECRHEDIALHWWIVAYTHIGMQTWGHCIALMDCRVYTHWNANMRTLHCIDGLSRTHTLECKHEDIALHWWIVTYTHIGMQTWGHCIALMDCHVHTHWNANMRTLHCIDGLSRTHIGMQTWGHCIALMDCRVHTHWNANMRTLHCIDGLSRIHTLECKHEDIALHWWIVAYTHIGMQTWGHCIALMDCRVHTHWNANMRTLHCIDGLSRTHTLECKHEDITLHWWIVTYTHWNANMRTVHCIDGLSRTHTLECKHEYIALHWWIVAYTHIGMQTWVHCTALMDCRVHTHWNANMRTLHCIDGLPRTHMGMQTWGHCIALMDCRVHTLECKHEDIALHWWIVAYTHIGMQTWGHCIALMDCRVHTLECKHEDIALHWWIVAYTHIGMQTWGHCIALMDCRVHTFELPC